MRILVLEDDPTLRGHLCRMIIGMGHKVSSAALADSAYRLLEQENWRFDLAILDTNVPGGLVDALANVCMFRGIPFVGMSMDQDAEIQWVQARAIGFLVKPVELVDLKRVLALARVPTG